MKTRLIKSSYLNNLQPSIKEELLGISGLLTQVFRKFGRDTKSQGIVRHTMILFQKYQRVLLTLLNDIQPSAVSLISVLGEAKEWQISHSINTKLKEATIY